jgi:hypothetical protein
MKPDKIFRRNILLVTICCREKDRASGLLPAIRRYRSERIERLARLAGEAGLPFAILSGYFGLLGAEDPIPYYDRLMKAGDIERIAAAGEQFLRERGVGKVIFCLPDPALDPHVNPYLKSMEAAAAGAGCRLQVYFLPPYPRPEELAVSG